MSFEHPSNLAIENHLKIQYHKRNPAPFGRYIPETLLFVGYYTALFTSFFICVNPYGRASRIRYQQTLNPIWRHGRKLLPFGIIIAGLAYADMQDGVL